MNVNGTAIVTGGSTTLGAAVAGRLARSGAEVTVVHGDPAMPGAALLPDCRHLVADVSDPAAVSAIVAEAADRAPLRTVVTCVSESRPQRTVGRSGPHLLGDFEYVVRQNLLGTFNLARLAAARMATQEPAEGDRGVLVMMSSAAAFDGQIGQAAYAASKGAILSMVLPMARDIARHQIRVVAIAPGYFRTADTDAIPLDARLALAVQVPHPSRLGEPEEFAALVAHVVENPMLNGETIRLDGAVRLPPR